MKNKDQHSERRSAERVARALAIQFRSKTKGSLLRKNDETWHLSLTTDMSTTGIAFESPVPFSIGQRLEMHVVMSGVLDIVKGEGRVVRVEEKAKGKAYHVAVELKRQRA